MLYHSVCFDADAPQEKSERTPALSECFLVHITTPVLLCCITELLCFHAALLL